MQSEWVRELSFRSVLKKSRGSEKDQKLSHWTANTSNFWALVLCRHSTGHWVWSGEYKEHPPGIYVPWGEVNINPQSTEPSLSLPIIKEAVNTVFCERESYQHKGLQWGRSGYFIHRCVRKTFLKEMIFKLEWKGQWELAWCTFEKNISGR